MTIVPDDQRAVEMAAERLRPANAFFLARLARLVGDVSTLTVGDEEFDYFIRVPAERLNALNEQITDLQLEVLQRYHVGVSAFAIPTG
jgi:hypothetical protein